MSNRNRFRITQCSLIPKLSFESQNRLIRLLKEIFDENPVIEDLKSNISFDKMSSNGAINPIAKLIFSDSGNGTNSALVDNNEERHYSSIRFTDFTPRNLSNNSLYSSRDSQYTSENFWTNSYNKNWTDGIASKKYGINVLRKITAKGYMLNFNDVRKLIEESISNRTNILDSINEFYYYSDKNYLLGVSTTNGILMFRMQAVIKILNQNNDQDVKKCFRNLLMCFHKFLDQFINMNIREVQNDLGGRLKQSAMNRMINNNSYNRQFYRYASENADLDEFKARVDSYIDESIKSAFKGTVFGIDDQYSYSRILSTFISSRRKREKNVFKRGFAKGMRIGLKFEMFGWEPCDPSFADGRDDSSMWWSKEVEIRPDSLVWKNQRYLIPELERTYLVTKLYINQEGEMRATGDHPNVSGSDVCMGNLSVDFTKADIDFGESLVRVEELLDMINYDSSYHNEKRDHLLDVSEIQESLFSTDDRTIAERVRDASSIRELGDDEDDDEDEEISDEEVNELMGIVTINDNNGDSIAEIQTSPSHNNTEPLRGDNYSMNDIVDDMVNDMEDDAILGDSVYELDESVSINDLSTINENGEQRQLVFTPPPPPPVYAPMTFSLGDTNLVGGTQ